MGLSLNFSITSCQNGAVVAAARLINLGTRRCVPGVPSPRSPLPPCARRRHVPLMTTDGSPAYEDRITQIRQVRSTTKSVTLIFKIYWKWRARLTFFGENVRYRSMCSGELLLL